MPPKTDQLDFAVPEEFLRLGELLSAMGPLRRAASARTVEMVNGRVA